MGMLAWHQSIQKRFYVLEQITTQKWFYVLERKLQGNSKLKDQYVQFLEEYARLGHMEKIEDSVLDDPGYYLSHYPMLKDTSLTTKLHRFWRFMQDESFT